VRESVSRAAPRATSARNAGSREESVSCAARLVTWRPAALEIRNSIHVYFIGFSLLVALPSIDLHWVTVYDCSAIRKKKREKEAPEQEGNRHQKGTDTRKAQTPEKQTPEKHRQPEQRKHKKQAERKQTHVRGEKKKQTDSDDRERGLTSKKKKGEETREKRKGRRKARDDGEQGESVVNCQRRPEISVITSDRGSVKTV
jgi:hypothetical protein